ncbi:hypothetical protein G9A89_014684 [Geosiphon pyriformis]|nr:hypothetical protein G9A89_014684 [Geosiphon pyriformis]
MDSLVKDPEIRVDLYILLVSLPERHNCQNKSGHQAEKKIGKQLTTTNELPHYQISVHYIKDSIKTFRYNMFRISSTEIAFKH